MAVILQIFAVI